MQADNQWTPLIQDTIAGNSALREGLHDDEAIPLVEWGNAQAERIGTRLAEAEMPAPTEEQVAETAYTLTRLMTRITWLAVYRHKKDADWLTKTFQMINKLNSDLNGPDAPTFSDDEIAAWIAEHDAHTNGELVQGLLAHLTPALPDLPDSPVPPETDTTYEQEQTPPTFFDE